MSTATEERTSAHDKVSVEPVSEDEALRQEAISSLNGSAASPRTRSPTSRSTGPLADLGAVRSLGRRRHSLARWVTAIWGFFLALDAWKTFGSWPRSLHRPISEADVAREMERQRRNSTRRSRSSPMM